MTLRLVLVLLLAVLPGCIGGPYTQSASDDAVENLAPLQRLDLSRSDPLNRGPFLSKFFISAPRRYKTLFFWRKSAVGELEALGFRQVQLIITVIFPILATTIWIISTHLSIKYLSY